MNISKIKTREDLKNLLKKELYSHELGFPVNKSGALDSRMAEQLILEVFDKAQQLINKPVTTTNEQPLECPEDDRNKCNYPNCGCQ